ncbi:hypothetical protein [Thermofilum sp.]|uniref:hypothetical protein n=1 Tax=Thermofilum sp. TaxID=1961369 RepID=UPI00319D9AD9
MWCLYVCEATARRFELVSRLLVEAEEYLARGMLSSLLRRFTRLLRSALKRCLSDWVSPRRRKPR